MGSPLKVWMHNKFQGHYPVGTAAVVIASNREDAVTYLEMALGEADLPEQKIDPADFMELIITDGSYYVLNDGNY
jgi:hypothetical protein